MPKLQTRQYLAPEPQFLAFPDHYVNLPGKIEFAELAKLYASMPQAEQQKLETATAVKPNAVLFNTIDYKKYDETTDPVINASILVHGFVRADRLFGSEKANLDNAMICIVNK